MTTPTPDRSSAPADPRSPPGRAGALARTLGRWWVLGLAVLIAGSVAWVALHGSEADAPVLAPSQAVEQADRLAGERVVVAGQVDGELPRGFILRGREPDRELLVVLEPGIEAPVRQGQPVWVNGSIRRFRVDESEFFGRLDPRAFRRFEGRPAMLASEVHDSAPVP